MSETSQNSFLISFLFLSDSVNPDGKLALAAVAVVGGLVGRRDDVGLALVFVLDRRAAEADYPIISATANTSRSP
jgi:hypothetical protein